MRKFLETPKIDLEQAASVGALAPCRWREQRDADGNCTGAMTFRLSSSDVQHLLSQARGATLELGGEVRYIDVKMMSNPRRQFPYII